MKKFFSAVIFATMILIGSQNNFASATDIYIGTYHTGYQAYVLSDTLYFSEIERYRDFSITVKAVKGNDIIYIDYEIWSAGPGKPFQFKNSQGYSGYVDKGNISKKLRDYGLNVWNDYMLGRVRINWK